MQLIYDGPRAMVRVQVRTATATGTVEHVQGDVIDYPDATAQELLASKRQRFLVPRAEGKKAAAKKEQGNS